MPGKQPSHIPGCRRLGPGLLWLLGSLLWLGCTVPRSEVLPLNEERVLHFPTVTYKDLQAEIATRCISCHNGEKAEGQYNMASYAGVLGKGSDATPNALAGDKNSLLLTVLKSDAAVSEHRVDDAWKARLQEWVVDFRLAYQRGSVHTSDIHLSGSKGFHGKLLQDASWDFKTCTSCHGEDLAGGGSGVSCMKCHNTQTNDGCSSCHQTQPNEQAAFRGTTVASQQAKGDVHQAHFRSRWMQSLTCADCHSVPSQLRSQGHLDGKVQVQWSARIQNQGNNPTWDADKRTCTNTYCHSSGMKEATLTAPTWKAPDNAVSCTTCHGNPPKSLRNGDPHPADTQCSNCHSNMKQDGSFHDPSLHLNGKVESNYPKACNACHGSEANAAPPRDLSGQTATTERGVGAHQVHLKDNGRHVAVACSACHKVPQKTEDAGHLDASLPAEVIFQGLATQHSLKPTWDRATNTCRNVYCHGSSLNGGSHTEPVWTKVDGTQSTCGSCHGNPPRKTRSGASHTASKDCYRCHSSMAQDGSIKTPSLHINGRVDL